MNYVTLFLTVLAFLGVSNGKDEWQLEMVQVLISNGLSSPDSLYTEDTGLSDVGEAGQGQLTLSGQKQLYAIGKVLKDQYKAFLTSNPIELTVQSTYLEKCMSSALCLVASLYEPTKEWEFIPGLQWQPIPVLYEPPHKDKLLHPMYDVGNVTKGGPLLLQMVRNFIAKSQDQLKEKKILIYSGQSSHLSGVLGAMENISPNQDPPSAATLVMEMLKRSPRRNVTHYGIRIKYYNNIGGDYTVREPDTLFLPRCTEICPLQFLENVAKRWEPEPGFRLFQSQEL